MHELQIESLAFGGEAVGHLDGKVVFVPFAAPGDRVRLRILRETASFSRGELLEVLRPGPGRRTPPCPYFGRCGGCQWQQLDYGHQLEHKQAVWRGALAELASAAEATLDTVEAAPRELGYRRRVRMHWQHGAAGLQLGYQRWRSRELLDVARCPLLEEPLQHGVDACRRGLAGLAGGAGTVVALLGAGGVHVSLRVERGDPGWGRRLARRGIGEPVSGGLVQVGRQQAVSFGATSLELPGGLRGAAGAFVQASVEGEQALRRRVLEWAGEAGQRAVELHAGIGTFTRELARHARQVTAVELSAGALALLRGNTAGLPVQIRAGDATGVAGELAAAGERFELAVLDPPREGCPGLSAALRGLEVQRIVYVSCDPMTLARDLREAREQGFRLRRVAALDLMPQTYHIESVALLER